MSPKKEHDGFPVITATREANINANVFSTVGIIFTKRGGAAKCEQRVILETLKLGPNLKNLMRADKTRFLSKITWK